jgi:ketosteroid isomerase-like protein
MPGPDADIQGLLDDLFRTICDQRDVEAFAALWADDDTITMWGSTEGEEATGIDEIRRFGTSIAGSERTFGFSWTERSLHGRGDVAWINATGTVAVDGRRSPYRLTAVFVRVASGWRWHTFNGSIPDQRG